jgi:phosphonate transport system permease protein
VPLTAAAAGALPGRDPAALRRWSALVLGLILLWPLLVWTEFQPWQLADPRSLRSTGRFVADLVPPRHDAEFLLLLLRETWRTLAIASAGLALAALIAGPLALAVSSRLSVSAVAGAMHPGARWARQALRGGLIVLRSIPELVWALVFVRVVGLGPAAGVLAIAIAYGGMLGKVWSEIIDSTDPATTQALLRNGCGRLQAFAYGALPACASELVSYTVYRWECAVRSSVVLGFVGAGGLGQQLDNATKMFAGPEVSAILIVFIVLVGASDRVSAALRRAMG